MLGMLGEEVMMFPCSREMMGMAIEMAVEEGGLFETSMGDGDGMMADARMMWDADVKVLGPILADAFPYGIVSIMRRSGTLWMLIAGVRLNTPRI